MPLSHGNLAASLANIVDTYELGPVDRSLLVMPLFHVHGLMAGALLLLLLLRGPRPSGLSPEEGRSTDGGWLPSILALREVLRAMPVSFEPVIGRYEGDASVLAVATVQGCWPPWRRALP